MGYKDIIIIAVIVLVVGAASFYIYKAKKSGKKCIGCPDSGSCGAKHGNGACSGCCSCCSQTNEK
ncbi:MAG: FeoB-associated Cys-rich membrane protein [Clostridia bacterium]|nr:FeoB-associated Cys-rich membrane protein [Clostridia bacterium]